MSTPQTPMIYLVRHGATEWALNGRHTGRTDIPLTEGGREQAELFIPVFTDVKFSLVLCSPRLRAQETAKLAGLFDQAEICEDLSEWDYGDYEGLTTDEIRKKVPGWTVFSQPCPNGETIEQVTTRAERVIDRCKDIKGNVALFAHGHILRVLVARWIEQSPVLGERMLLGTSTLSMLTVDRGIRVVQAWNGPLLTPATTKPWKQPQTMR